MIGSKALFFIRHRPAYETRPIMSFTRWKNAVQTA